MISPIDFNAWVVGKTIIQVRHARNANGAQIIFKLDDGQLIRITHLHDGGSITLDGHAIDGRRTKGEIGPTPKIHSSNSFRRILRHKKLRSGTT